MLMELEGKNGYPSHDARHIAENIQLLRAKLVDLNLDPDDTTAKELYHALLVKFEQDSLAFDVENSFHSLDFEAKVAKAASIVMENISLPQRWVLKSTAAKSLLRQHPPKKLMKEISYRSVGSMLKRENVGELFIAANIIESATWRKELHRQITKLDSTDFEMRALSIICIETSGQAPLIYNDDIGVLAANRTEAADEMRLLSLTVLLSEFLSSLTGKEYTSKSSVLKWWSDTDGLVAELDGEPVSFNVKDTALNHAFAHGFSGRQLNAGRTHFWGNLLNRYENQLQIEEDKLAGFTDLILMPKAPIRQPAFEYVEDF
jgi:hypothetical protein